MSIEGIKIGRKKAVLGVVSSPCFANIFFINYRNKIVKNFLSCQVKDYHQCMQNYCVPRDFVVIGSV